SRSGNFCPWNDDENAGVPRAPIMASGPRTRLRELVNAPGNDAPDCIAQSATTPRGRSRAALDAARASATVIASVKDLTIAERYTDAMAAVPPPRELAAESGCARRRVFASEFERSPAPLAQRDAVDGSFTATAATTDNPLLPFRSAAPAKLLRLSSRQRRSVFEEAVGAACEGGLVE